MNRLRRRIVDRLMMLLAIAVSVLTMIPLIGMIVLVVRQSLPVLSPIVFTRVTTGLQGGLANAIVGTFYLVLIGIAIAAPLGIFGGVYLGEIAPQGRFSTLVRMTTDVLAGVPSIVVGYFGYITLVLLLGWGFSSLAGGIALAIIGLPYIVRATEVALSKVPNGMREASLALGADQTTTIWRVCFRMAGPGILTGVLLALSIALGETAPLIYTAGWSSYMPKLQLTHAPIGYLTYVIWSFIQEPFKYANGLAYAAALILLAVILVLNIIARQVLRRQSRYGGQN